jgi:transglutaminase-like putative cysteine protease
VNPRVFNVDFTFELCPDPQTIDREKDLKLWLPVPGEWDSQRAVKIISVDPPPQGEYTDPEYGNRMYFWDFAQEPEKPVYAVNLTYRLESYKLRGKIDPDRVGPYNKTGDFYTIYTRSTDHVEITPEVEALAREAVGDEQNPYWQAKRIFDFVVKKVRFKFLRHVKGAGIKALLDTAAIDEKTGEKYYEGECAQFSEFFVALCRATGIPARAVTGMIGWGPWLKKEDLKLRTQYPLTQLSPDGLAATRLYGPFGGHRWAEFYLPNYGWVPVEPTWDAFVWLSNFRIIFTKGSDILIGPHAPQGDGEGYGDQWIPVHNGRIDAFGWGVWNIARVRVGNAKVVHYSDPFPADAFPGYPVFPGAENLFDSTTALGCRSALRSIDEITRGQSDKAEALAHAYEQEPRRMAGKEYFICHMLREVVGDKKFFEIFKTYTDLRVSTRAPVTTERFQEIAEKIHGESLDWFFSQWLENRELPQLRLENVNLSQNGNLWRIQGNLAQLNDPVFQLRVPIEISAGNEKELQHLWLDRKKVSFEFSTLYKPNKITVDPGFDLLKIQKMPPILSEVWSAYPNLLVVYGTLSDGQANKTAAERFNIEFLGLDDNVIKADVDVNEEDLNTRCLVLFGRPENNLIAQRFKDSFPIKFNGSMFTFQGVTYDQPTQGVAQIVENPIDPKRMIIMYAGLSDKSTQLICDKSEWLEELGDWFLIDLNSSYIVFDGHKRMVSGEWEDFDKDLVWSFK